MAKYGTRATANAVAELAFQAAEKSWKAVRYDGQGTKFSWDRLTERNKLRYIKAAHAALENMPPHRRFEEIDRLSELWKERNVGNDEASDHLGGAQATSDVLRDVSRELPEGSRARNALTEVLGSDNE